MAKFVTSTCGAVLELDRVPGKPGKSCPVCGEPLDQRAVDDIQCKPTDPNQPGYVQKQQHHELLQSRMEAVTSRDPFDNGDEQAADGLQP